MSTPTPELDLAAYFRRIGLDDPGGTPPTHATLARLVRGHAVAIPFENIEVLCGRVPDLAVDALQRKMVDGRRGGYCFEQNRLLMAALRQLGFAVRGREGRVRTGIPADVATGRTHMVLQVAIDGEAWLADVGFGGLAPTAPLRLASRERQPAPVVDYRFVDLEDDLLLQAATNEGWSDCYRIVPTAPQPIDYDMANWWTATRPGVFLRGNLVVARSVAEGRLVLFNDELALRRSGAEAPATRRLATRPEFADALADTFGLALAADDVETCWRLAAERAAQRGTST
jgi:N-hydroxyarylamine O-acetyltransferase